MIKQYIENLINFQIEKNVINKRDYIYIKNQIYSLLNLELSDEIISPEPILMVTDALNPILEELVKMNFIEDSIVAKDLFDSKLMNIFASLPSTVESHFYNLQKDNKNSATAFLYNYAKNLNYIRYDRILKNVSFEYLGDYANLQITINLSKPEKDPKSIMLQSKQQATNYPKCVLCIQNEGFSGNLNRDSRNQHRLIKFQLNNEDWYFQYSPYIYYNEHAIILSGEHRPMKIGEKTFSNLLNLVDQFDGYFFGSNADLPIVGGSILSHDHYQGGKHKFPIEDAKIIKTINTDNIEVNLLEWPLSTVRIKSKNKSDLVIMATKILNNWKNYSNSNLEIISHTGETPHNTITPIARFKNDLYELDLILRNNRTTEEYPLGIFHPHNDKWHIKKENIGLIEAIGLAILPARLLTSIDNLEEYYFNNKDLNEQALVHKAWFDEIKNKTTLTKENFVSVLHQEIGKVFSNVLIDCGVFKNENANEFIKFIEGII